MLNNKTKFPKNFLFGTATSAYQVEGAWNEDGTGESIWDRFVHSGTHSIKGEETADVAIDHYHKYKEDFDMLQALNTNAYRLSISWARILPEGKGRINQKGIDFYNNVINALIERGIEPAVTLFHWDLPAGLQTYGGWANREIVDWFLEYAKICFENFGDRVKFWYTLNEPIVFTKRGYGLGLVPPCGKDAQAGLDAAHNALVAHGKTVELFRKMNLKGQIGIALDMIPKIPATDKPEDIKTAQVANAVMQDYFYDAIVKGKYPELALEWYKKKFASPKILEGDMECISQKLDFIGINYYLTQAVVSKPGNCFYDMEVVSRGYEVSNLWWESDPQGFYDLMHRVAKDLPGTPIHISENGWSVDDVVSEDGKIHDEKRIWYLNEHLSVIEKCISENLPIEGYFLWSSFDNFEWCSGSKARFGIIYVDYETQKRFVKDSGEWYAKYIKEHQSK